MDPEHRASDRQSLMLTTAAIDAIRRRPGLARVVLGTLDHWDQVADASSKLLRDEWRRIVTTGDWESALAGGSHGQQLRQASPLGKALDPAQRIAIIRRCKGRNSSI